MSLHYLIDGYNLIYALPEMPPGRWEDKRSALLRFLRERQPQGNNPLTVVFDSRQGLGDQLKQEGFAVLFTAGETADERLGEMVRAAKNPRQLVVVSNDRGIQTLVRGTGAKFLLASDFLKKARTAHASPRRPDTSAADAITEEFKKKWL